MANEIEKRSLKTNLHMIIRGCRIVRELSPGFLSLSLLKAFINAAIPFIAIYMSAVIVDELTGNKDFNLLIIYASVTVGGVLLMTVISELLTSKINVRNALFDSQLQNYLNNIELSRDFIKLEDPKYTELREKIMENMFSAGGGIVSLIILVTSIAENSLSTIIAITLLYKPAAKAAAAGIGGIDNSVGLSFLLMAVIIGCIAVTIKNSRTVNLQEFKLYQGSASVNGYLNYYHYYYLEDEQAGKEVHIFDQRKLIIDEVLTKGRLPWLKVVNGKYSIYQKYLSVNSAISALIGGFAYIIIGLKALAGTISLGSVIKSYAAIIRLVSSVGNLSVSLTQIMSNNKYLKLLFEFVDLPSEMHDGKDIPIENETGWEIEFHNVTFRYPSLEKYAIKNLSIKITSNNRIAIVGMNGSGKTTMIKLLCGLYQPETGYITLNGKDIRKYDYQAYLKLFSVVFQDFKLLAFEIGQNVATSRAYNEEKVWVSLETAGIAGKVRKLTTGIRQSIYKNVEMDGMDISGGEEQKLAIARALYKAAPILILDEPTAALDPVAEYEIYSKFNEIIGGKAAVFVSHRLSSCRFCDTIVVFHDGQIVQSGTHDELLKNTGGKYYELWNAQAGYYQESAACISER